MEQGSYELLGNDMKIAVIGAGAIGSIVAAFLTKAEVDVVLIGREDQVSAVNENGLIVKKADGEERIQVKAQTKLDKEYDLVIFCTKTQDLEDAYQHNYEYLENCLVLTSQNGVQSDNIMSAHFERERMFSSIVMFGSTYTKPGEVTYNFNGDWILGKPFSPIGPKTQEIAKLLGQAFSVKVTPNIVGMKWLKLFVNFNNCIPALIGKSMQETFVDLDLCRLSVLLLREGFEVVNNAHIEMESLPDFPKERIVGLAQMPIDQAAGIINKTLTTLSEKPLYGSILQSIMRRRVSEIDFINGEVVHMAHQMRREALLNERVVDLVHRVERSGKYFSLDFVKEEFNFVSKN